MRRPHGRLRVHGDRQHAGKSFILPVAYRTDRITHHSYKAGDV